MVEDTSNNPQPIPEFLPFDEKHYKELRRKNIIRLLLTYLMPLLLIIIYFYYQYNYLYDDSHNLHIQAIAENQANTLDLFLEERLVNLKNVINDPQFQLPMTNDFLQSYLNRLKKESPAFVDIGYFDPKGVQAAYAGPYPSLEKIDYARETWYQKLKGKADNFIITDIYLGFRQEPHFTIGVSRILNDQYIVLRATLDPGKIYEYISSLKGSNEVFASIVNRDGLYQVVTPNTEIIESPDIVPPNNPPVGVNRIKVDGTKIDYAYSWLRKADWFLMVRQSQGEGGNLFTSFRFRLIGLSLALLLILFFMIIHRANKIVEFQKDSDRTRSQLEHAAKLASIGELASGIAHEINNPLAIISEKAGLMQDLMDPQFGGKPDSEEFKAELKKIQEAVFRCRDITRKLLSFVRRSDIDLRPHDINDLLENVLDGILGQEMAVSNIKIEKRYAEELPKLVTDGNQLQQVFLNLVKNGIDALEEKPGKISVTTSLENNSIRIDINDTGKGISSEQIPRLFMPFYTTKEVGKGTGLGLSVSYSIVKNLGGKISVQSTVGEGSTFTIYLPVR